MTTEIEKLVTILRKEAVLHKKQMKKVTHLKAKYYQHRYWAEGIEKAIEIISNNKK